MTEAALEIVVDGFVKSGVQCPLEQLDLSGTCVSTDMVAKLSKNVSTLRMLNLTSCRSVDRGMKRLLTREDLNSLFS
jgi:hypothetical protein